MAETSEDLHCRAGGEEFVVRREGDGLRIGQVEGGDVAWLDDTVALSSLSAEARDALESGDSDNQALVTALHGIATAEAERGG